jgi:hypothetical protein
LRPGPGASDSFDTAFIAVLEARMKNFRTIALSLALALSAFAPAAALARHGADDPPGDDRGGQTTVSDDPAGDDRGGQTTVSDDPAGDDRGARRSGSGSAGGSTRASRVRRDTGTCTGRSTAKLKVKPDDGRLETELEVDQNRNGVRWRVSLRRNGTVVASTRATTRAPSGSLQVERRLANRAGTDTISARAVSPSGEICTASVTI